MKVDLHCHTHFSDGKHDIPFLVKRGLANDVTHLAISDHDCIDALADIQTIENFHLIPAVEISCTWETSEVHVIGLCIDTRNKSLGSLLTEQQTRRRDRVTRIDEKLQKLGTFGLFDAVKDSGATSLSRSHVADFLVDRNICGTRKKAFKGYLGKRGKLYTPAQWCSMKEAIEVIRAARGISVLAHPGRYPLNRSKLQRLVETFRLLGGDALEASYPNIAPTMKLHLEQLGEASSLYLSCGSDFHDAEAHWTDVGKFPALSPTAQAQAVWHHPAWNVAD